MDPKLLASIERWNCLLAGVMTLVGALLCPPPVALGLAVGSILSAANFYAVHKLLESSVKAHGARRVLVQGLLTIKLGILLTLIFLALRYLPLSPVALAIGLSTFLFSIAVEMVRVAVYDGGEGAGEHEGNGS